jgi:hypothetical protein
MKLPYGDTPLDIALPDCDVTVAEPPENDPVNPR